MKPLDVDELGEALQTGHDVVFGSYYSATFPGKYKVECIHINFDDTYFIDVSNGKPIRIVVTRDGFGTGSGEPMFFWADADRQTDGKCHCASPKPVLLLVRAVCDGCGKDIR